MVTFNSTKRSCNITAPKPEVIGLLDDVPGGEPGLLPAALTGDNLKVWFTIPLYSDPVAGEEKYELFVDDETKAIATRKWTTPIDDSDRYLELPGDWLRNNDGQHRIYYKTTIYNEEENCSFELVMTLDTKAPLLPPADASKLIFPLDVLPPKQLTAYYLEGEDRIEAGIPAYTTPKAYDVITWYWDKSSSGTTVGGTKELTPQDYDKPLVLSIDGQWIRDSGDGDRFVWYTITDRAGNPPNGQSAVQQLIVNAKPVPRVLPPPKVVEASGTNWPVRGTLDPVNATNGVKVILNPESVIYHPDEVPQVRWGVEGNLGSYLADPVSSGEWVYNIPKEYMAPHFGKVIPVFYFFDDKHGQPHTSDDYMLTVLTFPTDRLQSPQCAEGSPLSLAAVPPEGASITLREWPFSAAGQQITIIVEGLEDVTGKTIKYQVLDQHVVTPEQATTGIAKGQALVEKVFLSRIRPGSTLAVKAYVSFDNGETWNGGTALNPAVAQFPWLRPRLIE
jgi:hypothetical protein